ncbi:MAG: helix-turn-helix domain-containing protein [Oscillospiraceae bacterium]|jgi:transcriptional regulator with XRE-family HTH domain|nr:helix-turn-helix domain-containing protein [Oscillospiraceae bacterium]
MHDIIRRLRMERGLTQQQVADHLNVHRSTYAYYESGRTKLNIDIMVRLAHFYRIRYAALLGPEPVPADG